MSIGSRIRNMLRYGVGPGARSRKRAARARIKQERFRSPDRWDHGEAFSHRRYDSYYKYLEHQASKLDEIGDRLRDTSPQELQEFRDRFEECGALAGVGSILCLGARLGNEVAALHSLGHFAVGIDLNPGADNPYVLPGDFHKLVFPDGCLDAVYTNAVDHVFDLDQVTGEVWRVLRPGGLFLAEVDVGYGEGHLPGEYEAIHWRDSNTPISRIHEVGPFEVEEVRPLGKTRRGVRNLVSFRKAD